MSVLDNVAYGPRRQGASRAKPQSARGRRWTWWAWPSSAALPREMSGGQQQRVALARAIVNRPKLLLLDEPLSALDLKLRKRMQLELKHLQARLGIAFVFVTHDQEEAMTMADRCRDARRRHRTGRRGRHLPASGLALRGRVHRRRQPDPLRRRGEWRVAAAGAGPARDTRGRRRAGQRPGAAASGRPAPRAGRPRGLRAERHGARRDQRGQPLHDPRGRGRTDAGGAARRRRRRQGAARETPPRWPSRPRTCT